MLKINREIKRNVSKKNKVVEDSDYQTTSVIVLSLKNKYTISNKF